MDVTHFSARGLSTRHTRGSHAGSRWNYIKWWCLYCKQIGNQLNLLLKPTFHTSILSLLQSNSWHVSYCTQSTSTSDINMAHFISRFRILRKRSEGKFYRITCEQCPVFQWQLFFFSLVALPGLNLDVLFACCYFVINLNLTDPRMTN